MSNQSTASTPAGSVSPAAAPLNSQTVLEGILYCFRSLYGIDSLLQCCFVHFGPARDVQGCVALCFSTDSVVQTPKKGPTKGLQSCRRHTSNSGEDEALQGVVFACVDTLWLYGRWL